MRGHRKPRVDPFDPENGIDYHAAFNAHSNGTVKTELKRLVVK
jgi:hypothetical protein